MGLCDGLRFLPILRMSDRANGEVQRRQMTSNSIQVAFVRPLPRSVSWHTLQPSASSQLDFRLGTSEKACQSSSLRFTNPNF